MNLCSYVNIHIMRFYKMEVKLMKEFGLICEYSLSEVFLNKVELN